MITKIPDVIKAFQGELFTNCNLSQTAALAARQLHDELRRAVGGVVRHVVLRAALVAVARIA